MEISSNHKSNKKAALFSILSNITLILLKLLISFFTGSISILSEALHSLSDLFASVITFFSVKYSETPPDEKHPYGHGRIENVTASVEAILIIVAAIFIFYEAIIRFFYPTDIQMPILGILVMFLSFIFNLFLSNYLYKVARKTKSIALEGDALHLRADMFSSLAIVLAFVLMYFFHWYIIDSIFAFAVAIYMSIEGLLLFKKSFNPLMDEAVEKADLDTIIKIFEDNHYKIHNLRTRKSGNIIFADVHLELPPDMSLIEAHNICDNIEQLIAEKNSNIKVNIHVEPIQTEK